MFLWWPLVLLQTTVHAYEARNTVTLIEEVAQQYHPACIFLIYSRFGGLQHRTAVRETGRALRKDAFLVLELNIDDLWQISLRCGFGHPLGIVMQADQPSRLALKKTLLRDDSCETSWLVLLGTESNAIERFFGDMDIPYNCLLLAVHDQLSEVYRIAPGFPLRTYTCRNVADCSLIHLHQRRGNLGGLVMRGITTHDPPMSMVRKYPNKTIVVSGFFGDVWKALENIMNFTTEFRVVDTFGTLDNGSWSGMVGVLQRHEADVAIAEFTMTALRLNAMDYTSPILFSSDQIFVRPLNNDEPSWNDFLIPFSSALWFTVVGTLFLFSIFLALLHTIGRRHGNEESLGPSFYSLYDTLLYTYGIFCQQGQEFNPRSTSCRLVYLCACIMAVVLMGAYSAALISSLTRPYVSLPFYDLQGLLNSGSYVLGTLNQSAELDLFKESNDSVLQQLYRVMDLVQTVEEGLDKACARKYAFVTTLHMLQAVAKEKPLCALLPIPDTSFPSSMSMGLTKHSHFKTLIDYNLHMLRDRGTLKVLRDRWWNRKLPAVKNPWTEVELRNITPILVVLMCGITVACVLVFLECRCQRHESFLRRLIPERSTLPLKNDGGQYQFSNAKFHKRYKRNVFNR